MLATFLVNGNIQCTKDRIRIKSGNYSVRDLRWIQRQPVDHVTAKWL